eukprot:TRINITY_DN5219_c0_g1_i1.p1 TRINITY_DN5219_c0_g1~~TRINITY_DN5219_c0_g1_i1.p1  ORF type:complete len:495 (-),score=109.12 TRINITY_DN5219_c0_g1_i1:265-1749(-)
MGVLVRCECNNVTLHLASSPSDTTEDLSWLRENSNMNVIRTGKLGLAGCKVVYESLARVRNINQDWKSWKCFRCLNCGHDIYAVQKSDVMSPFVNGDFVLKDDREYLQLQERPNYSSTFRIIIDDSDKVANSVLESPSEDNMSMFVELQDRVKEYLVEKENAMNARIEEFTKREHMAFMNDQTQSFRERKILWYKICKANASPNNQTVPSFLSSPSLSSSLLSTQSPLATSVSSSTTAGTNLSSTPSLSPSSSSPSPPPPADLSSSSSSSGAAVKHAHGDSTSLLRGSGDQQSLTNSGGSGNDGDSASEMDPTANKNRASRRRMNFSAGDIFSFETTPRGDGGDDDDVDVFNPSGGDDDVPIIDSPDDSEEEALIATVPARVPPSAADAFRRGPIQMGAARRSGRGTAIPGGVRHATAPDVQVASSLPVQIPMMMSRTFNRNDPAPGDNAGMPDEFVRSFHAGGINRNDTHDFSDLSKSFVVPVSMTRRMRGLI